MKEKRLGPSCGTMTPTSLTSGRDSGSSLPKASLRSDVGSSSLAFLK